MWSQMGAGLVGGGHGDSKIFLLPWSGRGKLAGEELVPEEKNGYLQRIASYLDRAEVHSRERNQRRTLL